METAELFRAALAKRGLDIERIVVNRVTPPRGSDAPARPLPVQAPAGTAAALRKIRRAMDAMRAEESAASARLLQGIADGDGTGAEPMAQPVFVESLGPDLNSVEDLRELGIRVFGKFSD